MAEPIIHNRNGIWAIAAGIVVLLALLFTFGGGHRGQPSGSEGNPMQTDQGR